MTKMIVFDMDGTIADLYGVDGWLEYLINEDTFPYENAKPLYDMAELTDILKSLQKKGFRIAVTTWLAKNGSAEYNKRTAYAKIDWLKKYNFPYDEIHCVKYGTTKANCTRKKADFQILVDDNMQVRKGWKLGLTIDATQDILSALKTFL